MYNKKVLVRILILIFVIAAISVIPLVSIYVYVAKLPVTYSESYYAALPLKYDNLRSVEGNKIVVIGGSSVAFGIDSNLVEQELNIPCVNFGLYAAFGLKPMLDLSIDSIEEGDVVIIAPELCSQMFSNYVGYDYLLQACETRKELLFELGPSYVAGFLGAVPDYIKKSKEIRKSGGVQVSGVYAFSSFDTSGDMVFHCDYNIMDEMYSSDNLPEITENLVTDEFINLVNEYSEKIQKKGATVYFGFCPINELSIVDLSEKEKDEFIKKIQDRLDIEIISSLEDHILDARYFYDSNFHVNNSGKTLNSVLLINDLKRMFNDMTYTKITIPSPPPSGQTETVIAKGSNYGFIYDITSTGVIIKGLDDFGKTIEKLEVPSQIENYLVVKIDKEAFKGCNAKEIILPSSIKGLSAGIFMEAINLETVVLLSDSLPEVGSGMLNGATDDLKILVPKNLYNNYIIDYFWGAYSEYIYPYEP